MVKSKQFVITIVFAILGALSPRYQAIAEAPPSAEAETERAMNIFKNGSAAEKKTMTEQVIARPEKFVPLVYFSLAAELHNQDRSDDAIAWYFAAILRSSFEAGRCPGMNIAEPIAAMSQTFNETIMPPLKTDPARARRLVERALAWDNTAPINEVSFCKSPQPSATDKDTLNKLKASIQADFKKTMETAITFTERQLQTPSADRSDLQFTTAEGKNLKDIGECSKNTSSAPECKLCCGALEKGLTHEQAKEVIAEAQKQIDFMNFPFRVPETIQTCLVQCSFADVARQIGK